MQARDQMRLVLNWRADAYEDGEGLYSGRMESRIETDKFNLRSNREKTRIEFIQFQMATKVDFWNLLRWVSEIYW